MKHALPSKASRTLDLHVPPDGKRAAAGYQELLSLLEDLGRRLDEGSLSKEQLRQWERKAIAHLHDREIDQFMRVAGEDEFEAASVAEQRWRNLRSILLSRKGLSPQIC